jgi:hypothetical protein
MQVTRGNFNQRFIFTYRNKKYYFRRHFTPYSGWAGKIYRKIGKIKKFVGFVSVSEERFIIDFTDNKILRSLYAETLQNIFSKTEISKFVFCPKYPIYFRDVNIVCSKLKHGNINQYNVHSILRKRLNKQHEHEMLLYNISKK